MSTGRAAAIALVFAAVSGCSRAEEAPRTGTPPAPFTWTLPAGLPVPKVPSDNPMNVAKVSLGRRLFYDTRLSGNETFSCATCHGVTGQRIEARQMLAEVYSGITEGFDTADLKEAKALIEELSSSW
jgi:cytochrome c peroxidase